MLQLEKSENRKLSIKEIAELSKSKDGFADASKKNLVEKIAAECKDQELDQEKKGSCNKNFLKQEMMADMEVTQIG